MGEKLMDDIENKIRWWVTNNKDYHIRGSFNRELYKRVTNQGGGSLPQNKADEQRTGNSKS